MDILDLDERNLGFLDWVYLQKMAICGFAVDFWEPTFHCFDLPNGQTMGSPKTVGDSRGHLGGFYELLHFWSHWCHVA